MQKDTLKCTYSFSPLWLKQAMVWPPKTNAWKEQKIVYSPSKHRYNRITMENSEDEEEERRLREPKSIVEQF